MFLFLFIMGGLFACEVGDRDGRNQKLLRLSQKHSWWSRKWIAWQVQRGAVDVDYTDADGDCALIRAARERRDHVGSILLAAGADPGRMNKNSETALLALLKGGPREKINGTNFQPLCPGPYMHRPVYNTYDAQQVFLESLLQAIHQRGKPEDVVRYLQHALDYLGKLPLTDNFARKQYKSIAQECAYLMGIAGDVRVSASFIEQVFGDNGQLPGKAFDLLQDIEQYQPGIVKEIAVLLPEHVREHIAEPSIFKAAELSWLTAMGIITPTWCSKRPNWYWADEQVQKYVYGILESIEPHLSAVARACRDGLEKCTAAQNECEQGRARQEYERAREREIENKFTRFWLVADGPVKNSQEKVARLLFAGSTISYLREKVKATYSDYQDLEEYDKNHAVALLALNLLCDDIKAVLQQERNYDLLGELENLCIKE